MDYKRIYFDAMGLKVGDPINCEITGLPAQDIHHINARGMGGSRNLDRIENLMAITRGLHEIYGDRKEYKSYLFLKHKEFLISNVIDFDEDWINNQINKYADF